MTGYGKGRAAHAYPAIFRYKCPAPSERERIAAAGRSEGRTAVLLARMEIAYYSPMRYLALLRGINVGGNTMIKMSELVAQFESLGFIAVKTYINSGNIAFDLPKTVEEKLVAKIEEALEKRFGRAISVMVREQDSIRQVIAANPFDGQFESHKEMHVLFLKDEMPPDKIGELMDAAPPQERFAVRGREIYCHLPMGVADSLLGRSFIEKKLKVSVTGRNWRTVEKLAEL